GGMACAEPSRPAARPAPGRGTTVGSAVRAAAAAAGERTAVVAWGLEPGVRRTWTFAELLRDAEHTAQALLARFAPGEHVAIWAPNLPEWLLLELGAGLAGLVIVTVNPAYQPPQVEDVLKQSRPPRPFTRP